MTTVPAAPEFKRVSALVLFADLVGSSEVGNTLEPKEYWLQYVSNFYAAITIALKSAGIKDIEEPFTQNNRKSKPHVLELTGDECALFLCEDAELRTDFAQFVRQIVRFTYILKSLWFISPFNLRRMMMDAVPRELAVGAHCGSTLKLFSHRKTWFAGHTVNVAKRIEQTSRVHKNLNFCLSAPVASVYRRQSTWAGLTSTESFIYQLMDAAEPEHRDLKGIEPSVRVNEMLLTWERKQKCDESRIANARKLIQDILDGNEEGSEHISYGADLVSTYFSELTKMRAYPIEPSIAVDALTRFGNRYASDSWAKIMVGFSLISLANTGLFKKTVYRSAEAAGKEALKEVLDETGKLVQEEPKSGDVLYLNR